MKHSRVFLLAAIVAALLAVTQPTIAAWWETGFDRWYYKDDWKAEFLSGGRTYGTTVTVPGEIARAWVEVWAENYTLYLNGEVVGRDSDPGTIEAYDITEIIHGGRNPLIVTGGPEVIVEGGVVLRNGKIVPIRSDATWGRKIKASHERRSGPRGYIGNAHQALMLDYTPEQRAKATISRLRSLVGRLRNRDQYRFWRVREPREALALSGPDHDLWDDVLRDSTEATTTAELTKDPIARGDWDAVERILNAPPRPVAPHLLDTASDLESRLSLLSLRNDCTALQIQLQLLASSGPLVEPSWTARFLAVEDGLRRATSPRTEDRLRPYLISQTSAELSQLRSEIEGRMGIRLDGLNRSTQNRLGWVVSNEPLDNDPRQWEFSFAPPSADVLDLAGLWKFRLDPKDEGATAGLARADLDDSKWDKIVAPHKWGWERLGYDKDNLLFRGRNNKPYNGHAWYRKSVFIPAAWKGRDLELDLGDRSANNGDWLYVNGKEVFFDASKMPVPPEAAGRIPSPAERGNTSGRFTIPASLVKAGEANSFAVRVFNWGNCGGLLGPRLQLYPVGSRPERLRTVCQAGIVHTATYAGGSRQVAYCGALCPAVLVSQTEKQFRIWGWQAKGYPAPHFLAYLGGEEQHVVALQPGYSLKGAEMDHNWLMLAPHPDQTASTSYPQVLLVVLQRKPQQVRWEKDAFGGSALVLDFATSPGVVALVRPLGRVVPIQRWPDGQIGLRPFTDGLCNRWGRMMRNYPTGYAEVYSEKGDQANVQIGYEFLETDDDWGTEHELLAPVPMLFNYARENNWPGAGVEICARLTPGARHTANPSATYCGFSMARIGATSIAYGYDRLEPRIRWKGIGTFVEIRDMSDRDFSRLRTWGATAERPQIAFDSDWFVQGFFDRAEGRCGLEGTLLWDSSAVQWLDRIVALHRRHNLTCILNWFWNADDPLKEINGAPPNSSRYWNYKPAARQLIIDFWAKVAEHYADLPRDAIAYDLLNEPAFVTVAEYNRFIKDATAAVRAHDKVHAIFVESANGWAQPEDFDRLEATGDDNTVYEFHFYGPHAFDSYSRDIWFPRYDHDSETYESVEALEERLLPPIRFSIRNGGAPLCHGEFGITFLGPDDSPRLWLEALLALHDKYRNHWSWWNWDGRDIHRTGLVAGDRVNPLVSILREFMKKESR
jgi:hypothetical protein